MSATVEPPVKAWTEADLEALPEDGFIHEVVNGELVMSPKNNFQHGLICNRLSMPMSQHAASQRLGIVLDSSTGFWMKNRNCRAPDVSFVSRARLQAVGFKPHSHEFFPGAPDLAVEILSPNNSRAEINDRLRDFFASGTRLAWLIEPETESVEVCRSLTQRRLTGSGGFLDGEDVLPGFRHPIADLFKGWDWE
ncbi:MAG: Uma2 family endonuclease [Verrucomicrobiae bacterium]|nr:Uma2 family endonuclease [Verrucomicrobiae bacterium]